MLFPVEEVEQLHHFQSETEILGEVEGEEEAVLTGRCCCHLK